MRKTRFARILPLTLAVFLSLLLPSYAEGAGCFYCFAGEINGIPFALCSDNLPPGGGGYRFCQEPEFGEGDECNFGPGATCTVGWCFPPWPCGDTAMRQTYRSLVAATSFTAFYTATASSCAADMMTHQVLAAESDIASEFITGFR